MRWAACDSLGSADFAPSCGTTEAYARLVLTLNAQADAALVIGWTTVVDLGTDSTPLPSFWQVQPGGCRDGEISAVTPNGSEGTCVDAWSASGASLLQSVLYPRPGGPVTQLRLVTVTSVPSPDAFTMHAGLSYIAGVLSIHYGTVAQPGTCTGCTTPACIVLNSATVQLVPGALGQPGPFVTPAAPSANWCTWMGGSSCTSVPTKARTWGQIKAMYR